MLKENIDIIFVSETFLDESVSPTFATIPGYSRWHRRDRDENGGGVALCFKNGTRVQILDEATPDNLEIIFFRYFLKLKLKLQGNYILGCNNVLYCLRLIKC